MSIEYSIYFSIPILYVATQYPMIIQIIMLKEKRDLLLSYTMSINVAIGLLSLVFYNYFNLKALYFWVAIEVIGITIYFVSYILILKKRLSETFDSEEFLDKDGYMEAMLNKASFWEKISVYFRIMCFVYLPIAIIANNILNLNCILEIIIEEILLVLNYRIWKTASKRFVLATRSMVN